MGFFDRFASKKSPPPAAAVTPPAAPEVRTKSPEISSPDAEAQPTTPPSIVAALFAAREKLEAKDLAGALALYEPVLANAGDRADVLVTISADLGSTGYVENIVELIAPRYDADRHGPATGLNLLQAYLATRNTNAAQHTLDILFALKRAELEERLHGFSNALAELIEAEKQGRLPPPSHPGAASASEAAAQRAPATISLISVSKPIWLYGLEALASQILPSKGERVRRIAFAQLSLPGNAQALVQMKQPEEEIGRLTRALPLWLAETFCFSPLYAPIAAVGLVSEAKHYALFPTEWTTENLRQLVETSGEGLDYIFTGALRQIDGDTEVLFRVWEVKKFRERKQFTARWTPATADLELAKLQEQIRAFMEWEPFPEGQGLSYQPPASPRAWIEILGASLTLFLGEKTLLSSEQLTTTAGALEVAAGQASRSESASLAWLTLSAKARALGVAPNAMSNAPIVHTALTDRAALLTGGSSL